MGPRCRAARGAIVGLVVLVSSLLGGCRPAVESIQSLSLAVTEFQFEPVALTAKAGRRVRLSVTNAGRLEHEVVIRTPDGDLRIVLDAGKSGALEFVVERRGRYEMFCPLPGHRESGERGELVLE